MLGVAREEGRGEGKNAQVCKVNQGVPNSSQLPVQDGQHTRLNSKQTEDKEMTRGTDKQTDSWTVVVILVRGTKITAVNYR